jgi:hypothetical protein
MAKRWGTSVEAELITLEEETTQRAVHNVRGTLGRRFKTSQQQLNHKQLACLARPYFTASRLMPGAEGYLK